MYASIKVDSTVAVGLSFYIYLKFRIRPFLPKKLMICQNRHIGRLLQTSLQHLWRQPGGDGRRAGGAERDQRRGAAGA